MYRHLHRFDRTKKFSTWVYTIASNLAKNELRNRSRNPLVLFQTIKANWDDEERPLQFEDTTARPDDMYRRRHLRALVEETVARLPEHHRQVFVLRELEGKSYEEIAEITDCNLGTVKSTAESGTQCVCVDHRAEDRLSVGSRSAVGIDEGRSGRGRIWPRPFRIRAGLASLPEAAVFWNRPRFAGYRLANTTPAVRAPLMDCREFRSKHVAYVDDLLAAVDMEAMRAHLACARCCARQDTAVRRSLLLVRNLPSIEPSPDFMIRLNARLTEIGPVADDTRRESLAVLFRAGDGHVRGRCRGNRRRRGAVDARRRTTSLRRRSRAPRSPPRSIRCRDLTFANIASPEVTPLANAAYVAAVPTGIPIWPAVLMAGETPVRFANMELQQPDGR